MTTVDLRHDRESRESRPSGAASSALVPKFRLVRADQLTERELQLWSHFQQADPALDSPYFRPEFTQAVAAVRNDVEVAILEQQGEPVGFFPFQRGRWNIGKPVGGRLSDFQGVIARQGVIWDAEALVRACGLCAWDFTHLVDSQKAFQPYRMAEEASSYMDLVDGFDTYLATRANHHSKELQKLLRKVRKTQSEQDRLRFEPDTTEPRVLRQLLTWKSEQYRSTGFTDVFAYPWTVALIERIFGETRGLFAGMLSALYLDDRLAAVHFGMRSAGVLHYWFTAYNRELAKHSPGLILLVETAQAAPSLGIRRIDLGKGSERYKQAFMSGSVTVAEGAVECAPLIRLLRRGWRSSRDWVYASPLRKPAGLPIRLVRRFREWLAFR